MTTEATMETVDGQERWYRIGVGRQTLTTGGEVTASVLGVRAASIRKRLRFLYAIGQDVATVNLVCEDHAGRRHVVPLNQVRTVHRTRKLPAVAP